MVKRILYIPQQKSQ